MAQRGLVGRVELDRGRSAFTVPIRRRELAVYTARPESCAGQDGWTGGSWVKEERPRWRLQEKGSSRSLGLTRSAFCVPSCRL